MAGRPLAPTPDRRGTRRVGRAGCAALVACLAAPAAASAQTASRAPTRVVVVAASLWDGSRPPTGPVSLIIEDGRIASVRPGRVPESPGEHRVDFAAWTIVPGGWSVVPAAEGGAPDGLDVRSRLVDRAGAATPADLERARAGATAVLLTGAPQATLGGVSGALRPLDVWPDRRVLVREIGLAAALHARTVAPRRTAMEATWEVRKALLVGRARGDSAACGDAAGPDAIARVLCRSLAFQVAAPTVAELARAVAVSRELGLRLLATDVRRIPEAPLPEGALAVLLAPPRLDELPELWSTYASLRRQRVGAGIAIGDVPLPALLALSLPHASALGLTRADVLAAFTAAPAELLGATTVGRLVPGRSADFLVLSGDPFDARTRVERVFVDGREVYDRQRPRR